MDRAIRKDRRTLGRAFRGVLERDGPVFSENEIRVIRRFFSYCNRVFDLPQILRMVEEGRQQPEIEGDALWLAMLILFCLRAGSVNALQHLFRDRTRRKKWERLLGDRPPSAKAMGYYAERVGCDSLRRVLHFLYTRLQRNRHIPFEHNLIP